MNTEIKPPIVTEDDVLKGSMEINVLARDGSLKKITVNAMSWRTALGATFKPIDQAMIHMLENCVSKESHALLDVITPLHVVWLTNVAQQLTNGIDALKKAAAAKAATPPLDLPVSSPSNVN